MFEAKIIEDSINKDNRLTTFQLCYPRFIHGELMTHRVFSRNAMSSRAIPVAKMIAQVRNKPASPIHWGKNQPGMQAVEEVEAASAEHLWYKAANLAAGVAEEMEGLGLHKQISNRILEPFQTMRTIVSATEWDNFYLLRAHKDAQPEFQKLALMMQEAQASSTPKKLTIGEWHLPYVKEEEKDNIELACKISAARCARVSYLLHDGQEPSVEKDLALFDRLAGSVPRHCSPLEHAATPAYGSIGNYRGWEQYRHMWERSNP